MSKPTTVQSARAFSLLPIVAFIFLACFLGWFFFSGNELIGCWCLIRYDGKNVSSKNMSVTFFRTKHFSQATELATFEPTFPGFSCTHGLNIPDRFYPTQARREPPFDRLRGDETPHAPVLQSPPV